VRPVALGCALAVVLAVAGCGDRERSATATSSVTATTATATATTTSLVTTATATATTATATTATATAARPPATAAKTPATVPGPGAGARPDPQLITGQRVVVRSGCLACHRVGTRGNEGPGQDLAGIGARMPASAIRTALLTPTSPMPSYRALPRSELRALVAYLSSLRDAAPGASGCRDEEGCG
jgi:mono/diheme cytochrome c family protein